MHMPEPANGIFDHTGGLNPVPESTDPFALLGLGRSATVDQAALRRAFLGLSRRIHPDRFQSAGGEQLARAEAWTSLLNKAHAVLRDQRARVLWLLSDAGLVDADADTAAGTAGVPKALLAEVFELREQLEEYAAAEDPAPGFQAARAALRAAIEASRTDFTNRLKHLDGQYAEAAQLWDAGDSGREKAAEIVRNAQSQEHFFRRLLAEIGAVLG